VNLTPMNDWVLVKMKEFPEERNGILIIEDSSANKVRTGVVLAVGPGKRNKETGFRTPTGLEPGLHIAFYRWNMEHQNGKRLVSFLDGIGESLGLIRVSDILAASPEEIDIQ